MLKHGVDIVLAILLNLPAWTCYLGSSRVDYKEPYSSYALTGSTNRQDPPPFIFTGQFLTSIKTASLAYPSLQPHGIGEPPTPSTSCMSSTRRTNLGCYCYAIGQRCSTPFSICSADENGDGYCTCIDGYFRHQYQCLTLSQFNNGGLLIMKKYII